ncbi:dTMP kinase [Kribbella catacumbae]|uniref:dTMP kinase n=1 Tax=Kribbella catacumbae TaxID=460086 RepID=UPI0012FBA90B|nr:dTMP kinase [Kribbella catacumbae]
MSFEGIDGSGKTTLSGAVAQELRNRGADVVLFQKKTVPVDADPYVQHHLAALGRLIWDDADQQPIHLLGDEHWVRLMAAYFAAVHEAVIQPAVQSGRTVVTDNWYFKFFARMTINTGYRLEDFEKVFGGVGQPTEVVYLDVDPAVASARKGTFTRGELGEHQRDGANDGFVGYQSKVAAFYRELAADGQWRCIQPGALTPAELAAKVVDQLAWR